MDKSDLYYRVTLEKLQGQEALHREFGTKASNLLALGAAMIGVGAVVLNLTGAGPKPSAPLIWVFGPFLGAFVFTGFFSLKVLWLRPWEHSPDASAFAGHLDDYEADALTEWVGDEYARSIGLNQRVLDTKENALKWGMISLAAEAVMLATLGFFCCWQL